jgi:hypothetical protein
MSLSTPFIKRPIATSLLTFALALAGGIAFIFLPVAPIPQIEYPTINVNANLPGASPDTMASSVATPLERQFGRIAGISEMTSGSNLGQTQVALQFDLNRNIDAAARLSYWSVAPHANLIFGHWAYSDTSDRARGRGRERLVHGPNAHAKADALHWQVGFVEMHDHNRESSSKWTPHFVKIAWRCCASSVPAAAASRISAPSSSNPPGRKIIKARAGTWPALRN